MYNQRITGRFSKATERECAAVRTFLGIATSLLLGALCRAQDPLSADPEHYKDEFENSQVRVVRVFFDSHYRSVMNQTPPRVVVVVRDEHFRVTYPDGTSEDRHLKAGTSFWTEGGKGIPENLSNEPFELIWIVPKTVNNIPSEVYDVFPAKISG